jgi:CubicO group peptidase (beta-lactamase class C family)
MTPRKSHALFFLIAIAVTLTGCVTPPAQEFKKAMASITPQPSSEYSKPALLAPSLQPPTDITQEIETIIDRHDIPGAVAVVLKGRTIIAEGAAGVRKRGSAEKVTLADHFEIASCAKSMTALVIAHLVDQGLLAWDRPVSSYFPEESFPAAWSSITLRELLTHTAGLREPWVTFLVSAYSRHENLRAQRAAFARKVLTRSPSRVPGKRVHYTNVDYILAAVIAERASGENWETLVQREVFAPLGLTSAGFGPPGEANRITQPRGHGKWRFFQLGILGNVSFAPESGGADYPAMASPAGFVHLTAHDWAAYIALQLRAHRANPNPEILLWTPSVFEPLHALKPGVGYSGGWFIQTRSWAKGTRPADTGLVLFHEGQNGRWTSAVWMAPERDFAILVACNQGGKSRGMDELVGRLMRLNASR